MISFISAQDKKEYLVGDGVKGDLYKQKKILLSIGFEGLSLFSTLNLDVSKFNVIFPTMNFGFEGRFRRYISLSFEVAISSWKYKRININQFSQQIRFNYHIPFKVIDWYIGIGFYSTSYFIINSSNDAVDFFTIGTGIVTGVPGALQIGLSYYTWTVQTGIRLNITDSLGIFLETSLINLLKGGIFFRV